MSLRATRGLDLVTSEGGAPGAFVVGGLTRAYGRVYDGQHTVVFWVAGCFSNIDQVWVRALTAGPLKRL
jgi:hypothetical protein